jgi:hypothetical protein
MDNKSTSALILPSFKIENLSTIKKHKHFGTSIDKLCNMSGNKLYA